LGACIDHRDRELAKEEHPLTSPGFLKAVCLQDQKKFGISCPPLQTTLSDHLQCAQDLGRDGADSSQEDLMLLLFSSLKPDLFEIPRYLQEISCSG